MSLDELVQPVLVMTGLRHSFGIKPRSARLGPSQVAQMVKNLLQMQETWVWPPSQEDPLEKQMATHSSILAWRIPWTEELQFSSVQLLSRVQLFVTRGTLACQARLSMEFSKQEHWNWLPFPSSRILPNPGLEVCRIQIKDKIIPREQYPWWQETTSLTCSV